MTGFRNVPDELHRLLKARARLAGMSLSDHLLREASGAAARPMIVALRTRLATRTAVAL